MNSNGIWGTILVGGFGALSGDPDGLLVGVALGAIVGIMGSSLGVLLTSNELIPAAGESLVSKPTSRDLRQYKALDERHPWNPSVAEQTLAAVVKKDRIE
jgi:hypothetical protein